MKIKSEAELVAEHRKLEAELVAELRNLKSNSSRIRKARIHAVIKTIFPTMAIRQCNEMFASTTPNTKTVN